MALPNPETWKQLSPLLDELLGLGGEARERRLAELRERDKALAEGLESLLSAAGRAEASHFLDGNANGDQAAAANLFGKQN